MESENKKTLPLITKISIGINVLLFGTMGIIYLTRGNHVIGYTLLAAGVTNILYVLFTIKTKNLVFVILNFLFAGVSLWVSFDSLTHQNTNTGMLWGVITLVYLIIAFILLLGINKRKASRPVQE